MSGSFFIIDGHSQIHRAHHARMINLMSHDGEPTKATYVFCKMLMGLLRENEPDYVAVAMDSPRNKLYRRRTDPQYKANRDDSDETYVQIGPQIKRITQILKAMGIATLKVTGFEADDIIATLVDAVDGLDVDVTIIGADKDLHQLLGPHVRMFDPHRNEPFTAKDAVAKWGVEPWQLRDLFAMIGDASDNIKGVPGVGPKTALSLLQEYGTLDAILRSRKMLTPKLRKAFRDVRSIRRARRLVTLQRDVPLDCDCDALAYSGIRKKRVGPIFRELGFREWSKW